jgi:tripartite-type tricarboxylate transporter receptor subunit TctC
MHRRTLLIAGAAASLASGLRAQAAWPAQPIKLMIAFPPGGPTDLTMRALAENASKLLGQPVVIENRPGAGGTLPAQALQQAKPDGYTLGMGNFAPLAVNQTLFKKLNFDPLNDLTPICLIERGPLILMVRNDSPYKTVKDLVAAAKASPGKLSYASGGIGGSHHLSGALFEHEAGIDMIHAPYKSGSAGATDLMGGQVHMMFEQMYVAMPAIQGGRMRALAITSKKRSPLLPDLPTMGEQGYPAVEVLNWQGLIGPKGLSPDLVKQLNTVCNQALQTAVVKEKILSQGNELGGGTPEQFAVLIKAEAPRWAKVVRDAKIEPE